MRTLRMRGAFNWPIISLVGVETKIQVQISPDTQLVPPKQPKTTIILILFYFFKK